MYRIDLMTLDDVAEVSRVERRCFTYPWPVSVYCRELLAPEQNYYVVLREEPVADPASRSEAIQEPNRDGGAVADGGSNGHGATRGVPRRTLLPLGLGQRIEAGGGPVHPRDAGLPPIIGFAGMWVLYDEAHVTTIGVEPAFRGRGLGELLLVAMFDEALRRGANWLTLEVRVSNEPAQGLYRKYGFAVQGTRKRYYSDNNEDALIMWSRPLQEPAYQAELAELRRELIERLDGAFSGFGPQLPVLSSRRSPAG